MGDMGSNFRKMYKMGKVTLNIKSIIDKLKSKVTLPILFDILSSASEAGELFLGHILFINKIKAYEFSKEVVDFASKYNDWFWLGETVFALIAELLNYISYIKELKKINEKLKSSSSGLSENSTTSFSDVEELEKRKEFIKLKLKKMGANQSRLWGDLFVSR